ncbi:hypothetical protein Cpir12675_004486 [Ceratocystis pirilliformis]|uniref:Major facilitator superfamily (MFS) profile domain-containing protein n=1 Tax=Ceratocystis pirilliformis TaxID=259994 RepID=A0ABR3YXS9_9PEZI
MAMLPMLRLLEDAVCHQVREDTSRGLLDETLCKTEEVQARLGYLVGWQQVAEGVVSIAAAMPYGILADRVGRKPALLLSWCGMIPGFAYIMGFIYLARDRNLYFVLVGSLFQVFGGGLSVAFSTIYAVASDVTANQNRATSFFYLAISATLGGISGPPLAGKIMMLYGPWAPIFVVLALSPPIIVLILLLPETLPQPALPPQKQAFSSSISRSISALSTSFHELLPSLQLLCNRNIQLVMAVFFLQTPIYIAYSTIMVQYVSHHFGWTIARTSYLFIPLGLLNILCLASLPRLSRELRTRLRLSAWRRDVALTRVALGLVAAGALIEWASRNVEWFMAGLVVGTVGSSNNPLARAVATRYMPREDTSRLMALIGVVETVGSFFGGPVLALCFEIGLAKKGWLTGLPYLYIAGLCGATLVGLGFLHRPVGREEECEDEDL